MAVSLNATIGLVTTKFTAGVARLGGAIKGIGSKIRGMVSGATGRLAMLAGAAGLGMVIRKAIALGSEMSDLADRTHTTVERFGALREISRDAGVEASILERALRNVGLRSQAAADGNKSYADALERLGINMKDFLDLDAGLKFEEIAKGLDKAQNKGEAFRDVATILGERAGPMLTETLREVADKGLDPLAAALLATGQIMSNDTAKSLDKLEDMFARAKDQMIIITGNMLNAFIPANGNAKDAVNDLVDKGVVLLAQALGVVVIALKQAVAFINFLIDAGGSLVDVLADLGPAFDKLANAMTIFANQGILGLPDATKEMLKFGDEAKKAWNKHGSGVKEAGKKFGEATKANAKQFGELINKQGDFNFLAELGKNKVKDAGAEVKKMRFDMQAGAGAAGVIARQMDLAKINVKMMQRNLKRLVDELGKAELGAQNMAGFMGDAAGFAADILRVEGLTNAERERVKQMMEAAAAAAEKMRDMTKEGFNALVKQKLQIEVLALEWLKIHQPQKVAKANQEELNAMIQGAINHVPTLRDKYGEVNERIDEAAAGLTDAVVLGKLMAANAELTRDHHGELMNNVWGVVGAQQALVAEQIRLLDLEMATLVDGDAMDAAKAKMAELLAEQAALNAEANKHPMIEPGLVNPDAADFRIFKEQKGLLQNIDDKMGGLFVNQ
jgi:hypothetical protein